MTDDARPALRAADTDRERAVAVLGVHASHGRLTLDELSERTDAAYAARTLPELDALLADLPELEPEAAAEAEPVPEEEELHSALRYHVASYVLVNVMLIAIWAVTGMDYFWPIWPILGWGVGVGMHVFSTREDVRRMRAAPPEKRAEILARSQARHNHGHHGHGHNHSHGHPRRLPTPPAPPAPPSGR